jgi:DNA-binding Lrp family transcriptional regulator
MVSNDRRRSYDDSSFKADALDLKIMQLLAEDGSLSYKELADKLDVDKRTVAKHFEELKRNGVLKITADINWPLIGVGAFAFVGTMTALGDEDVAKLYEYIRREPRVIEAFSTVGSDEYFLIVLDTDLQTLREEVLRKLEPLTADLSTAIVSTRIKAKNHAAFLSFLVERKERLESKKAR